MPASDIEYLALGVRYDEPSGEVHTFSRGICSRNPQTVADFLHEEDGGGYPFEQILLIHNDEVVEHWNLNRDYD